MANAENHRPGEPPEIRDEAADSPLWMPALGIVLLVVAAIGIIYQSVSSEQAAADASEAAEVADAEPAEAEAEAEEAPAAE